MFPLPSAHMYERGRSSFIIFIHELENEISRPNGGSPRQQEGGPTVAPIILLNDQSFLGIPVRLMLCISRHLHLLPSHLVHFSFLLVKACTIPPVWPGSALAGPSSFKTASVSWYTPHQFSPLWASVCKLTPFLNVINGVSNFSGQTADLIAASL